MMVLRLLPVILGCLLIAAHVLRDGLLLLAALLALLPFLLLVRRPWVPPLFQVVMVLAALEWVRTAVVLARGRIAAGEPWIRMAVILGVVVAVTAGAALLLRHPAVRRHFTPDA